jgi:hypothetical protein
MTVIPEDLLHAYRSQTFRWLPGLRLKERQEAVEFVKERGFVFFWPIRSFLLPSLWVATAGDRPVADEHDDPGHVTWGWKDALLGSQEWYYAKILRKKGTMISHALAPYFYALSENYGAFDEDYLTLYEQGRLTLEAKQVYEALLDKGPLDTVELRKATHLSSPSSETRFNRAISDLQADFKILPVGVTSSGAWHYAFAYDIVARHYPEMPDRAHEIRENQAREKLLDTYLRSVGAAPLNQATRLLGWPPEQIRRAIEGLSQIGTVTCAVEVENQPGEWLASAHLFQGVAG